MKSGWQESKLEDLIAEMRNGTSAKQNKEGKGFRVTRIETIASGEVNPERTGWVELDADHSAKYRLQTGDIIFSHINSPAHLGKSAIYNKEDGLIHGMNLMLLRATKDIDSAFLQLFLVYLKQTGYWLSEGKQSVNQASVNQSDIKKVIVPLPPLKEQQAIVDILDKAFAGVEKARANAAANLENAKELFQSALDACLGDAAAVREGWQTTTIGRLIEPIETTDPTKEPDSRFLYVDVSSVNSASFAVEAPTLLPGKEAPSRARRRIREGDVLFATIRPTLRRVAMVPQELDDQVCSTGYMVLRALKQIERRYLFYYAISDRFIDQMAALERGASYPAVSDTNVRDASILLPPLEEQQTIVDRLDNLKGETDRLQEEYTRQLEDLDELKQSLLQKAFAGELT